MTDRLIGAGHLDRVSWWRSTARSAPWRADRGCRPTRAMSVRTATTAASGCGSSSHREGDAMARVNVRFGESFESLRILRQSVDHLRPGTVSCARRCRQPGPAPRSGGPRPRRGSSSCWVEIRDGLVSRVHLASPSLRNWALFDHAFPNDVLTDFAFIEHSFGLHCRGSRSLMLGWIARGLRQGRITTRYPRSPEPAPAGFRGRVEVIDLQTPSRELADLCPTGAITVDGSGRVTLDRGRCILCGECVRVAPETLLVRRANTRPPSAPRSAHVIGESPGDATASRPTRRCASWRRRSAARSTSATSTAAQTALRNGRSRRSGTPTTTSSGSGSS